MITIEVEECLASRCPDFCGIAVMADVVNTKYDVALWEEIRRFEEKFRKTYKIEEFNTLCAANRATRMAYKVTGKDPNRYRPSAESLARRVLRGLPLYQISTLVDLINLLSLSTGHSIGGFDADKLVGSQLRLGIGRMGEPYEGIGKGSLNIEGMPVYRDAIGGIGTPTSDNERTKLSDDSTRLLMIINSYDGRKSGEDTLREGIRLLKQYAFAEHVEVVYF